MVGAMVVLFFSVLTAAASSHTNRSHQFRHSGNDINILLSNLQHSKGTVEEAPRLPYEEKGCNPPCTDDDYRREAIKYQILSKLGLKEKPHIRLPVPRDVVLETLYRAGGNILSGSGKEEAKQASREEDEELSEGDSEDYFGKTSEIIAFAEPGKSEN